MYCKYLCVFFFTVYTICAYCKVTKIVGDSFKIFLFVLPCQNLDLRSSRIVLCVWNEVAVQLTQHLLLRRPFSSQCTVFLLCHKTSCWLGLGLGSVFCSIRQIYFEVIIISLQCLIEFLYNKLSLKEIIFLFLKTISECFIMSCVV